MHGNGGIDLDVFYKGYVPTRNKKSILPFKGKTSDELLNYEQVRNLPEYAGILADDAILVDIDDEIQSKKLLDIVKGENLKCRVYKTSRGCHFLFMNAKQKVQSNKTGCKLAIGLTADIKLGGHSSYEVLKMNGVEREILYDTYEYQELPMYLVPIQTSINLNELESGNRNSTLYGYILPLQKADFTQEEATKCLELINYYIINEPLSSEELSVITRDDAFSKPLFFNGRGHFLFDKFANYLKNSSNIIKINGQLHTYEDGIYVGGLTNIEAQMIRHIPTLDRTKRAEVLSYLNLLANNESNEVSADMIAFKNGVYNVQTERLEEFSPTNIILNKIGYNYNPNAYSELMDRTLDKLSCHDKSIRMLLEEVIGYCFYPRNELGKAFILIGDKSNGKSTFLDCIKTLISTDNIASLDIKELGDRFKTAELFGKLANIGDDIGDEFIPNPAVFKKLVTGERVNVERKGLDPFEFNNYAKLLFSANNIPRIKDKTGAVQRRLVIIPFDAVFSVNDADYDPYIKYKLRSQECMEYLIRIGLEGLKRILVNQQFTTCDRVEKELREYEENNNPIIGFFQDMEEDDVINEPTRVAYRKYQEYCLANSLQPMSNVEFSKQIKKYYGFEVAVKRINGKPVRIFCKNVS